jgi:hypothetical protein
VRLVTAALATLGREELAAEIRVGEVRSREELPGGPHRVDRPPPLSYRAATLPDGRRVMAACEGPLGEWFAFVEEADVVAGRSLPAVLDELLQLPWGKYPPWVAGVLEQLAGHEAADGVRFPCPCCDQLTLGEAPPGTYEICKVCGWEDDLVQFRDPDYPEGANHVSLREARAEFARRGRR